MVIIFLEIVFSKALEKSDLTGEIVDSLGSKPAETSLPCPLFEVVVCIDDKECDPHESCDVCQRIARVHMSHVGLIVDYCEEYKGDCCLEGYPRRFSGCQPCHLI